MRLIDADSLMRGLEYYGEKKVYADVVAEIIKQTPAIDAVEVVRCKDCKHRDPEDKECDCGHDILWQLARADEWFCADGERREP